MTQYAHQETPSSQIHLIHQVQRSAMDLAEKVNTIWDQKEEEEFMVALNLPFVLYLKYSMPKKDACICPNAPFTRVAGARCECEGELIR